MSLTLRTKRSFDCQLKLEMSNRKELEQRLYRNFALSHTRNGPTSITARLLPLKDLLSLVQARTRSKRTSQSLRGKVSTRKWLVQFA